MSTATKSAASAKITNGKRVDPTRLKAGDLCAFIYWGKVENVSINGPSWMPNGDRVVRVRGICGAPESFTVNGNDLIAEGWSADQYGSEETVSQTEAIEILVRSFNRPFTVVFRKESNELRTLRGRLINPDPLRGRSQVEDLDVTKGSPLRLVDHRTLSMLIVGGVKYLVK